MIRPYSHSLSDDEKLYRCEAERVADAEHDPVKRFGALLVQEGVASQDELQQLKDEVDREINEAGRSGARQSTAGARNRDGLYLFARCRSDFERV